MKNFRDHKNMTDSEWEELASIFSGEKSVKVPENINAEFHETAMMWKKMSDTKSDDPVDVEKAWERVNSRIDNTQETYVKSIFRKNTLLRVAAAILVIVSIGAVTLFRTNPFASQISVVSEEVDINKRIDMPDGSTIYLHRNSSLSYKRDFGIVSRNVQLSGQAFFEISPDAQKPFIIDAGKASVRVVGTSFSVITENENSEVEVFVKTGKVLLTEKTTEESTELTSGIIGKTSSGRIEQNVNNNLNYLAWNTGKLEYRGEKLEVVFDDLKKFFNITVVADDPSILDLPWNSTVDYESQDKIILLICRSFNLSYLKDGDAYHLSEK